jgi:transcriptional regulator with XRE-family HTH domain
MPPVRSRSPRRPQTPFIATWEETTLLGYIGEQVHAARQHKGLSLATLGRLVGLSPVAITNLEHGRRATSLEKLLHLAQVLDLSYAHLFPDDLDPALTELVRRVKRHRQVLPALCAVLACAEEFAGQP